MRGREGLSCLSLLVALAGPGSSACSSPPAPYPEPVDTSGSRHPVEGQGGSSASATPEESAGDDDADEGDDDAGAEEDPCTQLSLCCAAFPAGDPAIGPCQEATLTPSREGCANAASAFCP